MLIVNHCCSIISTLRLQQGAGLKHFALVVSCAGAQFASILESLFEFLNRQSQATRFREFIC